MSTPAETAALYTALEQAIGSEPTDTLMEHLPDRTRFATKDDLGDLENSLQADPGARFDQVDDRFDQLDDRFHQLQLAMHGYVRTFVVTQVTSIFGAVGLFLGIQQLL